MSEPEVVHRQAGPVTKATLAEMASEFEAKARIAARVHHKDFAVEDQAWEDTFDWREAAEICHAEIAERVQRGQK